MTRADNPQGTKVWLELKCFTTLIIHCKFQILVFNRFWENDFSTFSPHKYMETQIWSCRNKVKGQLMVIICINLVDLESSMLYTKILPQSYFCFWGRRFLSVSNIYGHGGHLVQLRGTIWTNWQCPFDRRPHIKSGENCSSIFREKYI